jgi:hypothetical protein
MKNFSQKRGAFFGATLETKMLYKDIKMPFFRRQKHIDLNNPKMNYKTLLDTKTLISHSFPICDSKWKLVSWCHMVSCKNLNILNCVIPKW